jgi:hypothetical protein
MCHRAHRPVIETERRGVEMISMFTNSAPTGLPGTGGVAVRERGASPSWLLGGYGSASPACTGAALRRAPEAFTAPFRGTGLPVTGLDIRLVTREAVVTTAVGAAVLQQEPAFHATTDITDNDATLGVPPSRRPQS